MYAHAKVTGTGTLNDMVDKLAGIPLKFSPGTKWNYGVSTDVCGYLVEQFSGQALDEFVAERITGPLDMPDSGFHVRADAAGRFAACYNYVAPSTYRLQDDPEGSRYHRRPAFFSGGGGMVGTIDDYHRFACMLLAKGELGGERLLGRKTVEYMAKNHHRQLRLAPWGRATVYRDAYGTHRLRLDSPSSSTRQPRTSSTRPANSLGAAPRAPISGSTRKRRSSSCS